MLVSRILGGDGDAFACLVERYHGKIFRLVHGVVGDWHQSEDEFVIVTEGTCTLVDDQGRHEMSVGACAAFPAGEANGHHFINETDEEARFLVVGTKAEREVATYSDVDLKVAIADGQAVFTRKDGTPYEGDDA